MTFPRYWDEFAAHFNSDTVRAGLIEASDGHPLHVLEMGWNNAEALVIVMPIATPFLMIRELAQRLAQRFHVVTWESRGSPFLEQPAQPGRGVDRHARDLTEVLGHFGIERAHLLGWCSGAYISTWANHHYGLSLSSATLIAPSNISDCQIGTPFRDLFVPLLTRVANSTRPEEIAAIAKVIQDAAASRHAAVGSNDLVQSLSCLNLRSKESIRQYAQLVGDFNAPGQSATRPPIADSELFAKLEQQVPVAIFHCRDDTAIDYRCSLKALENSSAARAVVYSKGGHFIPLTSPEALHADIESFIGQVR